jgi:hypothetical protein
MKEIMSLATRGKKIDPVLKFESLMILDLYMYIIMIISIVINHRTRRRGDEKMEEMCDTGTFSIRVIGNSYYALATKQLS